MSQLASLTSILRSALVGPRVMTHALKFDLGEEGAILIDGRKDPADVTNRDGDADCTVTVSSDNLVRLLRGDLNGISAMTSGKVRISGDMKVAMSLQALADRASSLLASPEAGLADLEHQDAAENVWTAMQKRPVDHDRPLPTPTRDIQELKKDFDAHGYCLIADALSPEQVAALKMRVTDQLDGEEEAGIGLKASMGDRRTSNLLVKGDIFQQVLLHPIANAILEHGLGDGFLISTVGVVQTVPGSLAQGLHIDQAYLGFPTPVPVVANCCWMLEDFTEANGATRMIPGSHLWDPDAVAARYEHIGTAGGGKGDNPLGTVPATGKAGTCMVFDGRVLHGTGKNLSADQTRTAIFTYYCRPWVRQFENPFLSIPDDVMMGLPLPIRESLGYKPWFLCGGYEIPGTPAPMDVVRPMNQVRQLEPGPVMRP